jgi:hypothetical protein
VSLCELPKTTFLTTEAVAVSLQARCGKERAIYSDGFFEAISSRVVNVKYASNPYPELCVVRSLITAYRLNMAMGPELCDFIAEVGSQMSKEDLEAAQLDHYGRIRYLGATLAACISDIIEHVQRSASMTTKYGLAPRRQLELNRSTL